MHHGPAGHPSGLCKQHRPAALDKARAFRDDVETILKSEQATCYGIHAHSMANRIVHLAVLHDLLPECP